MQFPDEILDWLHEKLGENADYQLEVCDRTISILQSIMSQNQKQDRVASIRVKDLEQKAKEYRMESRAMKVTLNLVGLTLDQLSESCWKYLSSLSKTAELLKLSDLSDTSYIIGLTDLRCRMELVERENCKQKRKFALTGRGCQTIEILKQQLQSLHLDPVFIRINGGRELNFRSHEHKFYHGQMGRRLKQLKSVGASSSVSHKKIVSKKQELHLIQKKCLSVHYELEMFHNLPPSFSKIEAAIQELEGEKKKLERRLSGCIDSSVL